MRMHPRIMDTKPLIHCSPTIITKEILHFLNVYNKCPLCNSKYVTQLCVSDMFWIYYTLKKYQPTVIIQNSIIGDGLEWLISEISPRSRVISVSADMNNNSYIRISFKREYKLDNFINIDWTKELGSDFCNNTLVITTGNEDVYSIVCHAFHHNIPHLMFTNNYPTTQGNCLTLKKILSNKYHITRTNNTHEGHFHSIPCIYKSNVINMYDYYEFPPIYLDCKITRWNDYFKEHNCKLPIFEREEDYLHLFIKTQLCYTFICFIKMTECIPYTENNNNI